MASKVSAALDADVADAAFVEPDNEPHRLKQAKEEWPLVYSHTRLA
jgi:hypothetical protein